MVKYGFPFSTTTGTDIVVYTYPLLWSISTAWLHEVILLQYILESINKIARLGML